MWGLISRDCGKTQWAFSEALIYKGIFLRSFNGLLRTTLTVKSSWWNQKTCREHFEAKPPIRLYFRKKTQGRSLLMTDQLEKFHFFGELVVGPAAFAWWQTSSCERGVLFVTFNGLVIFEFFHQFGKNFHMPHISIRALIWRVFSSHVRKLLDYFLVPQSEIRSTGSLRFCAFNLCATVYTVSRRTHSVVQKFWKTNISAESRM